MYSVTRLLIITLHHFIHCSRFIYPYITIDSVTGIVRNGVGKRFKFYRVKRLFLPAIADVLLFTHSIS